MNHDSRMIDPEQAARHVNFKTYVHGYALSILLTLMAYFAVVKHLLSAWVLVFVIAGLAVTQAIVQLVYFLHLGKETKPRWNMVVFLFMTMVVVILVFGSVWIMHSLSTRVMPPMDVENYMHKQQSF